MIFDFVSCMKLVKIPLKTADRRRTAELTLAMGAALDELAMRLRSKSFISSYGITLSAATRETTLTGVNNDLRQIFALTLGAGVHYRVMIYRDPQQFLRDHNDPRASAGYPVYFTQLVASGGAPTVRFSEPLVASETLKVYYFQDMTTDNISAARSISAVSQGTLAYFFGLTEGAGLNYYNSFHELAALSRAADTFLPNAPVEMGLSREDKAIRRTVRNIQANRR